MQIDVHALICEQVEKLGSRQKVADALGVSRAGVSLYLSGKFAENGGRVDRFEQKAIERFCDRVLCPHLGRDLAIEDCLGFALRAMPLSDPPALRHWAACQTCAKRPGCAGQEPYRE